jgi:hypothetical protein
VVEQWVSLALTVAMAFKAVMLQQLVGITIAQAVLGLVEQVPHSLAQALAHMGIQVVAVDRVAHRYL